MELSFFYKKNMKITLKLDRHISRISRENGKWICETFLARNASREIARKIDQFWTEFGPVLTKKWPIFKANSLQLKGKVSNHLHFNFKLFNNAIHMKYFEKKLR